MTLICVNRLNIIGAGNGLSPGRRQINIWTNAGILLNRNFSEIFSETRTFSRKSIWKFCLGLNVLNRCNHAMNVDKVNVTITQHNRLHILWNDLQRFSDVCPFSWFRSHWKFLVFVILVQLRGVSNHRNTIVLFSSFFSPMLWKYTENFR